MKVEFIGTGSIFATSNSASYLINDKILVDIPNGCCKALKRMNKDVIDIEYIFITHFHGDHFLDIPFLLSEIYARGNKKITLIGGTDLKEKVYEVTKLVFPNSYEKYLTKMDINYLDCEKDIVIDDINISSIKVNHGRMKNPYGYVFKYNDKIVTFSGDTSICDEIEKASKNSKFIVIDVTIEIGNEAHIGIDNLEYLANKYKNTTFITTHMRDNLREQIKSLNLKNVVVASDGDILSV